MRISKQKQPNDGHHGGKILGNVEVVLISDEDKIKNLNEKQEEGEIEYCEEGDDYLEIAKAMLELTR